MNSKNYICYSKSAKKQMQQKLDELEAENKQLISENESLENQLSNANNKIRELRRAIQELLINALENKTIDCNSDEFSKYSNL